MNSEVYFDQLGEFIKSIKIDNKINFDETKDLFCKIVEFDDLSFQDIITYMLYCFQIIEITQKWKLKKSINYDLFIKNMDVIYDEVFCNSNMKLKSKIFALTCFGNIIIKTINYGIDEYVFDVLDKYVSLISEKKAYLQNTELSLLRGNLYGIVYSALKDNADVNEKYNSYIEKLQGIFNYDKFLNMAEGYFEEIVNEDKMSYDDITNLLLFKTYNKVDYDEKTLDVIIFQLFTYYRYDFFDKNIFIDLLDKILKLKLNLDLEIEYYFEDKEDDNRLIINYNNIDCSVDNNIENFIKFLAKISKYKLKDNKFLQIHKSIDDLILKKEKNINSVFNYENLLTISGIAELKKILDASSLFDNYFLEVVSKFYNSDHDINIGEGKKYLTDNELFEELYCNVEIKELLKDNELLSVEYNENGNYKDLASLLKENIKDKKLYNNILNFRNSNLNILLNDYYMLLLFDGIDTNLIKEKEKFLKKVLPNCIENNLSFYGNLSKEKSEEIFNDYINPCIKKISQTRLNNKTFDNTKDFLNYEKSNSDNYFGICKLQEILEDTQE